MLPTEIKFIFKTKKNFFCVEYFYWVAETANNKLVKTQIKWDKSENMGRQQGVPNWNADVAYDVISRIMPTSSTAWKPCSGHLRSERDEPERWYDSNDVGESAEPKPNDAANDDGDDAAES